MRFNLSLEVLLFGGLNDIRLPHFVEYLPQPTFLTPFW
jgi:hypothetical protein